MTGCQSGLDLTLCPSADMLPACEKGEPMQIDREEIP